MKVVWGFDSNDLSARLLRYIPTMSLHSPIDRYVVVVIEIGFKRNNLPFPDIHAGIEGEGG